MTQEIALEWRDLLLNRPPGTRASVDRCGCTDQTGVNIEIKLPELLLYCDGDCKGTTYCRGARKALGKLFGGLEYGQAQPDNSSRHGRNNLPHDIVIAYSCETCLRVVKSYSVRLWSLASSISKVDYVDVEKIAEWPPFAPPTPAKLLRLIPSERELFLKGRRAEIEGMGIGAFSYYRRIVEGQKDRLLDEIIRVSRHLGVPDEAIAKLETAKSEIQFSKAVESVKAVIPEALFIKGHNPLTLLHSALSKGLHNESDEDCLTAATDVRLLLIELAERLASAMADRRELDEAIKRITGPKQ